ncbi:MAG: sigma-54-dependent Fis family transcriptional regulator [Alteromonadaceae bacterium]|nr:sigma-54-dependent Fis family transcriptional regulator [Alteromonadaceae bacterium]
MKKLLIIDDDVAICRTLQIHFSSQNFQVQLAHDAEQGLLSTLEFKPQIIILDIRMPGKSGLEILPELKAELPDCHIIMITAFHDMESTIAAMQQGADEYIHKPIDLMELDNAVSVAIKACALKRKDIMQIPQREVADGVKSMVGSSKAMRDVFKTIGLVAKTPTTILITGESGTGKEMAARAIHASGTNPDGPFIAINCAAMAENLIESELFGHTKGSFTGAIATQIGKFELANGGSIFLDEVGELSPATQAKLLRILQEKEYSPLGSKEVKKTTARVISATNRDLLAEIKQRNFREDLYYRLQIINIQMPPLRDRYEELPTLVNILLAQINQQMHKQVTQITNEVMALFKLYAWPGNVRELENMLTKAVALCQSNVLTINLFPQLSDNKQVNNTDEQAEMTAADKEDWSLQEIEREHVANVLAQANWHKGKACEILGVSRPRLQRLIVQYSLEKA